VIGDEYFQASPGIVGSYDEFQLGDSTIATGLFFQPLTILNPIHVTASGDAYRVTTSFGGFGAAAQDVTTFTVGSDGYVHDVVTGGGTGGPPVSTHIEFSDFGSAPPVVPPSTAALRSVFLGRPPCQADGQTSSLICQDAQ
jgi:hypothetical protein